MSTTTTLGAPGTAAEKSAGRTHAVTLIPGDGIGPEVVAATRRVLAAAGVGIDWETCEAGAEVFRKGLRSGVPRETVDSLARTRVALKGPLETPVGYGEKSANVTLRKLFETYANLRPVRELPGVPTPFSGRGVSLLVVRENVEDLYAGIEHRQTPDVAQCLKLVSRTGCEKVIRYAFETARAEGRRRVHAVTKANIMKLTEGLFKKTFEVVAAEYPEIEAQHLLVDNAAHQLVKRPEEFEVLVTTNMNGDILSDLTSGLVGGLGFAPGANIGRDVSIFEAVHGSAPKYAGKDVANPTAVILSAVLMLRHLGELEAAGAIEDAVLVTFESGERTRDVPGEGAWLGTSAFTDRVLANLGRQPRRLPSTSRRPLPDASRVRAPEPGRAATRRVAGVDVFVDSSLPPSELGASLEALVEGTPLRLKMVSNRGTVVFPDQGGAVDCVDHFRCRFRARDEREDLSDEALLSLLDRVGSRHRWMHVEKLHEFDGEAGWTRAQGED